MVGHRLLSALASAQKDVCFIEIGAGDGVAYDHLHRHAGRPGWRGVMVEPVPHMFERLARTYADVDGVALENSAVAAHDGEMPFFHLVEVDDAEARRLPPQYNLLGSFSRELLARQVTVPEVEDRIVETRVRSMTPATLLARHGISGLDLLVVDAEGLDCDILAGFDLERLRPRVIAYEDVHVAAEQEGACRRRLEGLGYELMREEFDTWCVDVSADDHLTAAWRAIRERGPAVPRDQIDRWFG